MRRYKGVAMHAENKLHHTGLEDGHEASKGNYPMTSGTECMFVIFYHHLYILDYKGISQTSKPKMNYKGQN